MFCIPGEGLRPVSTFRGSQPQYALDAQPSWVPPRAQSHGCQRGARLRGHARREPPEPWGRGFIDQVRRMGM